jgi:hypothetical protein
LQESIDGD